MVARLLDLISHVKYREPVSERSADPEFLARIQDRLVYSQGLIYAKDPKLYPLAQDGRSLETIVGHVPVTIHAWTLSIRNPSSSHPQQAISLEPINLDARIHGKEPKEAGMILLHEDRRITLGYEHRERGTSTQIVSYTHPNARGTAPYPPNLAFMADKAASLGASRTFSRKMGDVAQYAMAFFLNGP